MDFGFLKRKREEIMSVEDAERMLLDMISTPELEFRSFLFEKFSELRKLVRDLLDEVQSLDSGKMHPRLRNQAENFKSAMENLWKGVPEMDQERMLNEVTERLEKVAVMRVKQFRFLFGVYPPEIEQIDSLLKSIAEAVREVELKRKELGLDRLLEVIRLIERLKELTEEERTIRTRFGELSESIEELRNSESRIKSEMKENRDLQELKRKEEELNALIAKREAEIHRKIAYARKPLRVYAHMTGRRINLDTHHILSNMDDISMLASGAASEIRKGSIRLKEKSLEMITGSLDDIASGKLKSEFEELKKLRNELTAIRNRIKTLKKPDNRQGEKAIKELQRKIEIVSERKKKVEMEIGHVKRMIEGKLSELTGKSVRLIWENV